jgi:hypothetical protein
MGSDRLVDPLPWRCGLGGTCTRVHVPRNGLCPRIAINSSGTTTSFRQTHPGREVGPQSLEPLSRRSSGCRRRESGTRRRTRDSNGLTMRRSTRTMSWKRFQLNLRGKIILDFGYRLTNIALSYPAHMQRPQTRRRSPVWVGSYVTPVATRARGSQRLLVALPRVFPDMFP